MRAAVFYVQYKVKNFGLEWGGAQVPVELRPHRRLPLFRELIDRARTEGADLAALPGGFFRTDYPGGVAVAIKRHPPGISVLVGRDNLSCKWSEAWIIARTGRISRKVPEVWTDNANGLEPSKLRKRLQTIDNRGFQIRGRWYAVYCCGDILIDTRTFPVSGCEAAFVLAHNSARGRFSPKMQRLGIPAFLSQHVKQPANTIGLAYRGKRRVRQASQIGGEFHGLGWIARIYEV